MQNIYFNKRVRVFCSYDLRAYARMRKRKRMQMILLSIFERRMFINFFETISCTMPEWLNRFALINPVLLFELCLRLAHQLQKLRNVLCVYIYIYIVYCVYIYIYICVIFAIYSNACFHVCNICNLFECMFFFK